MVNVLAARGLSHTYPNGLRAIGKVDFEVEPGKLVCLLGPNGSGKSTLMRLLTGILAPSVGEVSLDGQGLTGLSSKERARRIASVPQVLAALPDEDVRGFILGGRYPHASWWGRTGVGDTLAVRRALEEVDGAEWEERRLQNLSGGQAQRVLVARALAQEADYLLFDEPTTALDPEHQVLLFELFGRLSAKGRAVLIATHELHLAGRFADRIALLDQGSVVASGAPVDVLTPEVLGPVFGDTLLFSTGPGGPDGGSRPLVVPWPPPKKNALDSTGDRI